jgi:hypothetical protein
MNLTVFLEGAFNGTNMNTTLSAQPHFPMVQPYNQAPWNYNGTENLVTVPSGVVDWILVELRDASAPENADETTIIEQQAGLLKSNGNITGLDGVSPLSFHAGHVNDIYIVVYHRNHLGIISAGPAAESGGNYSYDFSTGFDKVHGGETGFNQLSSTIYGMVGGDGVCDGFILPSDLTDVWELEAGHPGYHSGDFNLDGQIDNQDKNDCWVPNQVKSSQVPQ